MSEPTRLVFLGDVKQAIPRISPGEWEDVPKFFEAVSKVVENVSVVVGNHDGDLEPLTPRSVKILPSSGVTIGRKSRVGLFHGHAWPSPEVLASDFLVMGHIHPVVRFRDEIGLWMVRQIWMRAKCDGGKLARAYLKYSRIKDGGAPRETFRQRFGVAIGDPELVIMPAFNDIIGGLSVNRMEKRLMGPVLRSRGIDIKSSEAYLLDGTYLGTVQQLSAYF